MTSQEKEVFSEVYFGDDPELHRRASDTSSLMFLHLTTSFLSWVLGTTCAFLSVIMLAEQELVTAPGVAFLVLLALGTIAFALLNRINHLQHQTYIDFLQAVADWNVCARALKGADLEDLGEVGIDAIRLQFGLVNMSRMLTRRAANDDPRPFVNTLKEFEEGIASLHKEAAALRKRLPSMEAELNTVLQQAFEEKLGIHVSPGQRPVRKVEE